MKIFIITWLTIGFLTHLWCYFSWSMIKKNKKLYKEYLIKTGVTPETDPLKDNVTNLVVLIVFVILGYLSPIILIFKYKKK